MDFLQMAFIDPFTHDWMGIVIGILMRGVALFVVGMILWGIIYLMDSSFLPTRNGEGKVVALKFTPAHTTSMMVYLGYRMTTRHPDDWSVTVGLGFGSGSISVNQQFYKTLKISDRVKVGYVHKRISNKIYIKEIYRKGES